MILPLICSTFLPYLTPWAIPGAPNFFPINLAIYLKAFQLKIMIWMRLDNSTFLQSVSEVWNQHDGFYCGQVYLVYAGNIKLGASIASIWARQLYLLYAEHIRPSGFIDSIWARKVYLLYAGNITLGGNIASLWARQV